MYAAVGAGSSSSGSGSGGGGAEDGLSEADWARLYSRVMPNPIGLDAFKTYLCEGKLQEVYLAKDLHKIVQEMRDILREHGELREAATFPTSGRKGDLARAAAAAVRVLTTRSSSSANNNNNTANVSSSSSFGGPLAGRVRPGYAPAMAACAATLTRPVHGGASPPALPLAPALRPAQGGRPSLRDFPFATGNSNNNNTSPTVSAAAAAEAVQNATPHPTPSASPTRSGSGSVSSANLVNAGRGERRTTGGPHGAPRAHSRTPPLTDAVDTAEAVVRGAAALSSTALTTTTSTTTAGTSHLYTSEGGGGAQTSVGTANELAMLNERASPFMRILSVIRRLQLRYGSSHPLRFDIPVQYAQAVNTRRLRVQLIPLRHPNLPARWPAAREVVVYVNDQCITTPWRRAWPEREQEVEKSYLVLDLTQLLVRGGAAQRLRVDVFHKDYFAAAVLAVVQPLALDEVVEAVLRRVFGESQLSNILAALTSGSSTSAGSNAVLRARLRENDEAVLALYARVMDEGRAEEEADGLEADDPIIATTCPVSRTPMEIPVRGAHCRHLQCVDLRSYLVSGQKACYWNCVLCDLPLRVAELQVDTVLWRYLAARRETDSVPPYLRLAVRPQQPREQHAEGNKANSCTYEWYASPPAGVGRGSLVEDDEDDDADDKEATSKDRGMAPQVKPEGMTDGQRDGDEAYDASYKRSREDEAQTDKPYDADGGTADCPIEL